MNNHDYPWGADGPDAPWNQGDPVMTECSKCSGTGNLCEKCEEGPEFCCCNANDGIGFVTCTKCEGSGEVEADPEDFEPDYDDIDN